MGRYQRVERNKENVISVNVERENIYKIYNSLIIHCIRGFLLVKYWNRLVVFNMISKITEKMMMKHVEKNLGKYEIKLMHFIPGRIRLQSFIWKHNGLLINTIIAQLKEQILVYDVQFTKSTGSLLITYDASHVTDMRELESWFYIVDEVYHKEFTI